MNEKIMHASKIGFPCERNLWYSCKGHEEVISERTQRIFDVGTYLEPLVVKWLKKDGWNVAYNQGSQNAHVTIKVPANGGELVGHPDALIWRDNQETILVDIKTMNDRAFTLWKREGTIKKYPQYVDQLHVYAATPAQLEYYDGQNSLTLINITNEERKHSHHEDEILRAYVKNLGHIKKLGIAGINKNTSEMHIDIFDYDPKRTEEVISRAEKIFACEDAPEPGNRMQTWGCNYCGYSWLCELAQKRKETNVGENIALTNDPTIVNAIELLKEARELSKTGKELEDEAKQALDENVRKQGIKAIRGGDYVLTLTETKAKETFDKTAFGKKHPELLKEFTKLGNPSLRYDIKEV